MSITKQQILDNLEDVKKYIEEAEKKETTKSYTKEDLIDILKSDVEKFNSIVKLESDGGGWQSLPKVGDLLDLSGAGLSEADLSEADLSEADLSGANLYRADLSGAGLYRANLSGANLSEADLSEADLSGAGLYGANLSGAALYGADLYEANLSGSDFYRSIFYGKGTGMKLKRNQVEDFLLALGFTVVD